jgi:hypothetical protein
MTGNWPKGLHNEAVVEYLGYTTATCMVRDAGDHPNIK